MVLPNFVKSCLFIFAYSEKFHQSRVNGSFLNFGCFCLRRSLHFGTPKFCQILSLFVYPEISSVQSKWLNFEFWHSCLKNSFVLAPPDFVKLYSFFIFAYPENFMYLA